MKWPPFFKLKDIKAFFIAVRSALENSPSWRLHECGTMDGIQFLNADYVGKEFDGEELGFAACSFPDKPEQIQLTMHARNWPSGRIFVTEDEYMAAERMALPVFRKAAQLIGRPLRLSRPIRKKHLVGHLAIKFRGFCTAATAHWNAGKLPHLHQFDWERFYKFICAAHRVGSALEPEEVCVELARAGFNAEIVKELTEHYEIGRRILAVGTWQWHRTDADVWHPWNVREDRKRSKIRKKMGDEEELRRSRGLNPPHTG